MNALKDEAMRALEGSLQQQVSRSEELERKLTEVTAELASLRSQSSSTSASLEARTTEVQELRTKLANRDAQAAELKAKAEESEAQREQAEQRLLRLRGAGQDLLGKLGASVLTAQEISSKPRPLEGNLIKIPPGEERDSVAQLQANFQAVFDAYSSTLAELEVLTASVVELGPAMTETREALALKPGEAAPMPSKEESAKLEELERAWRERCAAHRDPNSGGAAAGTGAQSTGGEAQTFEVVVPQDAQPGDILTLTTQTGQRMKVVVPEGAEPGDTLTLAMTATGSS